MNGIITNDRPLLTCRFGVGVLYPTLESFKAIESAGSKDDTQVSLLLCCFVALLVVAVVGGVDPKSPLSDLQQRFWIAVAELLGRVRRVQSL
jgi:hypothetical protein